MSVKSENSDRHFMEMAVEVMNSSIQETRKDKTSPNVGAVLVKPDGRVETAFRGEMREGDHAEYTLIDRKNRTVKLDGSVMYVTLEPCAPGARNFPKLSCAERQIKKLVDAGLIERKGAGPGTYYELKHKGNY